MPYPLPLTRTEAYLAYKAGAIQQSDLKPSLAVSRNGIDAWLAYWTGLAADYPKREDGTPHILQEEEAYIAYLCGVINEYPEKCLRRVGAYLRYLISARWGRPDHPLNREELYLSLIKTQYIPSGDPSSDIVINGTAKAPFVDVKMYGDTYQQSYTGKNLCDYTAATYPYSGNGITAELNDDGSITVTGLPTKDYIVIVLQDITDIIEDGAIYTISCDTYGADFYLDIVGVKPGGGFGYPANTRNGSASFTVDKTTFASYQVRIETYTRASWGAESKTVTRKFQLEKGSTASSFEPYVGGVPSPNPDYPQTVQTVTGEQTVVVTGKNLAAITRNAPQTQNGVTCTWNGASFTLNGTTTASTDFYGRGWWGATSDPIALPAGTYTISLRKSDGSLATDANLSIDCYYGTTHIIGVYRGNYGTGFSTVTFDSDTQYSVIYISLLSGKTYNNEKFYVQLEKSESPTTYEPYTKQTYPINLGSIELCKLGDYQDYIWKDGEDWKVHKEISKVMVDGTIGAISNPSANRFNIDNLITDYKKRENSPLALCDRYTTIGQAYNNAQFNTLASNYECCIDLDCGAANVVRFKNTKISTSSDFAAALEANPLTLYYVLATPTDTTITDQTLIAQLESLVAGGAENGTTYIKVNAIDPNLPGLLYVEAPKYE